MEIRFCDRCTESIPDVDFDSGRAVTVDGKHWHVHCAMARSLGLGGPRSWLTLLLALYAAGVATFVLVATFTRPEEPAVSAAVKTYVDDATTVLQATTQRARAQAIADAVEAGEAARAAQTEALREEVEGHLEVLGTRIGEIDRLAKDRVAALSDKVKDVEGEIGKLSSMIREVLERAEAEASRRAPAEPVEPLPHPTPPSPTPPEDTAPQPGPPEEKPPAEAPRDAAHDAEVDRWIQRLRDSNENIRFSATLELGRLKDLRAAAPLVDVLKDDRDYYVRLGAATALGDMKACDAVLPLVDALDDKDSLVRTAANDALQAITGNTIEFVAEMSGRERRKVMKEWRDWWKDNEAAVRARLGQS